MKLNISHLADFNRYIVRTPACSLNMISRLGTIIGSADAVQKMGELFSTPFIKEAIYVSSEDFYYLLEDVLKNPQHYDDKKLRKIQLTFVKYLVRISTRCTPFGLFAGCAVGTVSDHTAVELAPQEAFKRATRVDMNFMHSFSNYLSNNTSLKNYIRFRPNSSLYQMAGQYRYIEYISTEEGRKNKLVSIEKDEVLELILESARKGVLTGEIKAMLSVYDFPDEDIDAFITDLIQAKLLVSELEPAVTGPEPQKQMLEKIKQIVARSNAQGDDKLFLDTLHASLQELDVFLEGINTRPPGLSISSYEPGKQILAALHPGYNEKHFFQTDMQIAFKENCVDRQLLDDVKAGIDILARFSPRSYPSPGIPRYNLKKFKEAFRNRYEDAEVPLIEALDTESGIGYIQQLKEEADFSPLINDLVIPPSALKGLSEVQWDKQLHTFFLRKYLEAIEHRSNEIVLQPAEITAFEPRSHQLARTFSAVTSVIEEDGQTKIVFHQAGGATAGNMLGRFCQLDEQIHELARDVSDFEIAQAKDFIIAEVAHLPESRHGNVILRPVLGDYEIPYLAHSTLSEEQIIPITDLLLVVRENKLFLRSKKLNRYILPRLSCAHNFMYNTLPIYHFLCDLQFQHSIQRLFLNIGILSSEAKYFPRVSYKNLILLKAWWQFKKEEFEHLVQDRDLAQMVEPFRAFCKKYRIPRTFVVTYDEEELFVDQENDDLMMLALSEIRAYSNLTIVEAFFDYKNSVTRSTTGDFTNEFIFQLGNKANEEPAAPKIDVRFTGGEIKRNYVPADEWIYFKLYAGIKSAEKILLNTIRPFTAAIMESRLTDKWFFIRYSDPHFHLRFRVRHQGQPGEILSRFNTMLEEPLQNKVIWKVELDTYSREIERYRYDLTADAETLFWGDSEYTLSAIDHAKENQLDNDRYLFSLAKMDNYYSLFGLGLKDKMNAVKQSLDYFYHEFRADRNMKKLLDAKFHAKKHLIAAFLDRNGEYETVNKLLEIEKAAIGGSINNISNKASEQEIQNLLSSYIHMHINRMFRSKQRLHELVLYYFLSRYYNMIYHTSEKVAF